MSNSEKQSYYPDTQPKGGWFGRKRRELRQTRADIAAKLEKLETVKADIADQLTEARTVAKQLKEGSSYEVVKAVQRILSSKDPARQQFPQLNEFINQAQLGHLHAPLLRAALRADVPVWLYGEAGSGKSTAAEQVADNLELSFRSISLGPSSSKADLMGYRDGYGRYQGTGFREAYEYGGVFLLDEIDNAHPSILTILNNAIANRHGEFPDGRVVRHEMARFVAAANTIGKGATVDYVGRSPIDAATTDRFAFISMDIDNVLEESLVLGRSVAERMPIDLAEGGIPSESEWLADVRAHRQAVQTLGFRAIMSTRSAIYGTKLIQQGVGSKWLRDMLLYKGMRPEERDKLAAKAEELQPAVLWGVTNGKGPR